MNKLKLSFTILILAVFCFTNYCSGQSSQKLNVAVTKPKMKATEIYTKGNTYLEYIMAEAISESTDIIHFIDRGELELINKHRASGFKKLDSDQGSAQMQGVEYLLESKILNFSEKWEKHCHVVKEEFLVEGKKKTKTTLDTCKHSSILLGFNMELELISVETGEVVSKRNISPSAWSYEEYIESPTDEDKNRMRVKAYDEFQVVVFLINCFSR